MYIFIYCYIKNIFFYILLIDRVICNGEYASSTLRVLLKLNTTCNDFSSDSLGRMLFREGLLDRMTIIILYPTQSLSKQY